MNFLKKFFSIFTASVMILTAAPCNIITAQASTARYMENLDRGLIAMQKDGGIYLTWRLLGTEEYNTTFDVYRDGTKITSTPISDSTDYFDASGKATSIYKIVSSNETEANVTKTATAFSSGENYLDIPVAPLPDYVAPDGTEYPFKIMDASVGDLDGDGEYEIVVKREANHQHAAAYGVVDGKNQLVSVFGYQYIEAYKLDGTILWRLDMGVNCRPMTEFVFLVYDFNGDGAADIACKTAPGSKDGTGRYVSEAGNNLNIIPDNNGHSGNDVDYRTNPTSGYYKGYIEYGSEWFTLFDGRNGKALDTIEYPILRGTDSNNTYSNIIWRESNKGDGTHRGEKCMGVVSYLDGVNPGIVLWRGIYTRIAAASISIDKTTSKMSVLNHFDTYSGGAGYKSGYEKYKAQGNHSIAVGDVDNDGKDEVMSGGLCLDDNMSPLWCTYRGHGDSHHLGDYDPTNDTLEYLTVQEESAIRDKDGNITNENPTSITNDFGEEIILDHGITLINAKNGKELFHVDHDKDTGRGMMANTGQGGYFQITAAGLGTYTVTKDSSGNNVYTSSTPTSGMNNRIFWDGDLYDEFFDCVSPGSLDFRPAITKYNLSSKNIETIFTNDDTSTINYTKANPLLQADIFGDWREELILTTNDSMAMRIFTTNIPTDNKLYTLMHDSLYRQGIALQNQYYNQPPHIGYYVCEKSDALYNEEYDKSNVKPDIQTITYSGSNPTITPTPIKTVNKTRNDDYVIDEDGDYYNGVNNKNINNWTSSTEGSVKRQIMMAATCDVSYLSKAKNKDKFSNNFGKFLLFSAAGDNSTFKTTSEKSVSGFGKLNFTFMTPGTYSDNGSFAHGNAPTTIFVGDGAKNALEFTVTPNMTKGYAESATLSVNGTNICSYTDLDDIQTWTKVECAMDNNNKKAYIAVTKADGKIYTAEVAFKDADCGNLNTFGINEDKYYGTILLDEINLYQTNSLEKPTAIATAQFEKVEYTPSSTSKTHFYELNIKNSDSGSITGLVKSDETKNQASSYNVENFRTSTLKTAAIPALDGWGYIHAAYDNTSGRQTSASVNADTNSISLIGTNNVGGANLFFIPKNIENLNMPTSGTLTYKFNLNILGTKGSNNPKVTLGFTSASNNSSFSKIGNVAIEAESKVSKDVKIEMTYDLDAKTYSLKTNDEIKASGNSSSITGIYILSERGSWTTSTLTDFVLDSSTWNSDDDKPNTTQKITASRVRNEYGSSGTAPNSGKVWLNFYNKTWGVAYFGFDRINNFDPRLVEEAKLTFMPLSYGTINRDRQFYFDLFGTGNNWTTGYVSVSADPYPSGATKISSTSCQTNFGNGDILKPNTDVDFDITNYVKTLDYGTSQMSFIAAVPSGSGGAGACEMTMKDNPTLTIVLTKPTPGLDYNITFNSNGGTINSGAITKYIYGTGANLPSDVTKTGYTFGGWYDNAECTGTAITAISTEETGHKTYWAKWTLAPIPKPTSTPVPEITKKPTAPIETPDITENPIAPTEAPASTENPAVPTEAPASTEKPIAPTEAPASTENPAVPTEAPASTENPAVPTEAPASTENPIAPTEAPASTEKPIAPTEAPASTEKPTIPTETPDITPTPSESVYIDAIGEYAEKVKIEKNLSNENIILNITKAENYNGELPKITAYVAEYDKDGRLTSVKSGIVEYKENIIVTAKLPKNDNYKLFLWDKNQKPITKAIKDIYK